MTDKSELCFPCSCVSASQIWTDLCGILLGPLTAITLIRFEGVCESKPSEGFRKLIKPGNCSRGCNNCSWYVVKAESTFTFSFIHENNNFEDNKKNICQNKHSTTTMMSSVKLGSVCVCLDRADGGWTQTQEAGLIKRTPKRAEARTERLAGEGRSRWGKTSPSREKSGQSDRKDIKMWKNERMCDKINSHQSTSWQEKTYTAWMQPRGLHHQSACLEMEPWREIQEIKRNLASVVLSRRRKVWRVSEFRRDVYTWRFKVGQGIRVWGGQRENECGGAVGPEAERLEKQPRGGVTPQQVKWKRLKMTNKKCCKKT